MLREAEISGCAAYNECVGHSWLVRHPKRLAGVFWKRRRSRKVRLFKLGFILEKILDLVPAGFLLSSRSF